MNKQPKWIEALQIEVMEDYISAIEETCSNYLTHEQNVLKRRKHWDKLVQFIIDKDKKLRDRIAEMKSKDEGDYGRGYNQAVAQILELLHE